jgi:fibronectin-binding autotransporter adhesin
MRIGAFLRGGAGLDEGYSATVSPLAGGVPGLVPQGGLRPNETGRRRALIVVAASVVAFLSARSSIYAANAENAEYDVVKGQSDLTAQGSYTTGGTPLGTGTGGSPATNPPAVSSDVTFDTTAAVGAYSPSAFTINNSVTFGSLDDLNASTAISISNTSASPDTLTLGGMGDSGNAVSGTAADLLYIASGGSLTISGGSGPTALGLVLGQAGNFDVVGSGTISSVISGNGFNVTKTGGGSLTFYGTNTYTGTTIISAGTIQLGNANALVNSAVTLANANSLTFLAGTGATYTTQTGSQITNAFNLATATSTAAAPGNEALTDTGTNPINLVVGNGNSSNTNTTGYYGLLTGTNGGGLIKTGSGAFYLECQNISSTTAASTSFTGQTIVDGGTLVLGDDFPGSSTGWYSVLANSAVNVNSGATLQINVTGGSTSDGSSHTSTNGITLNGGSVVDYSVAATVNTLDHNTNPLSLASGANVITLAGTPNAGKELYLSFTNTVTDDFSRSAGSTGLFRGDALNGTLARVSFTVLPSGSQIVNGVLLGTFVNDTSSSADAAGIGSYSTTLSSITVAATTSQGAVSGFTGSSTTNYTFTGAVGLTGSASANSVNLATGASIDGAQPLSVTSGMILDSGTGSGGVADIGGTTPGTLAFGSAEGIVYVDGLTGSGQTLTIGSVITGSNATNGLTFTGGVNGAGNLILTGSNTYTGATTINSGTLTVDASSTGVATAALANTSAVNVATSGTLHLLSSTATTATTGQTASISLINSSATITISGVGQQIDLDLAGQVQPVLGFDVGTVSQGYGIFGSAAFFADNPGDVVDAAPNAMTATEEGYFTGDGGIDVIPEPGSLGLLGLLGIALTRRRRKAGKLRLAYP